MKLYQTDASLTETRYHLQQNNHPAAKQWLNSAARLITETGYHLRDKDLKELQTQLSNTQGEHHD